MAPTDAKDLVRRYYDEVLSDRRRELLDELLAPDFLSHAASGQRFDRTVYVAAVAATYAAFPDLVATMASGP